MKAVLASVLGAALLSSPAAADPAATARASGKGTQWLMIQTAAAYRLHGRTLTLTGVSPSTMMFTDRPQRVAEQLPTDRFIQSWARAFISDPPNAGITSVINGKLQTVTVELTKPRLSGTTLTYEVRLLKGSLPKSGGSTSVFIDSIHPEQHQPTGTED